MAQLTQSSPRTLEIGNTEFQDLPVLASISIFQGSLLGISAAGTDSGYVRQLVATDDFAGIAMNDAINTSGASGAISVTSATEGFVTASVAGASVASLGVEVYASDGNTFTTTSTSNSSVGKVVRWLTGTMCVVKFQAIGNRSI
jgi:hypothetical protein